MHWSDLQNLSFVIDRVLVMMAAVLLLIPSVFGAVGTYINCDILTYLPPELDSMAGEQYLENGRRTREAVRIAVPAPVH